MSSADGTINKLPSELLRMVIQLIYLDHIPLSAFRTLDPFGLPSAHSDGRRVSTTPSDTRRTLYNLCLVNNSFYHEARVLLFRRVQITLPFSFILLLRSLGSSHLATAYDEYQETGQINSDPEDPKSFTNMVAAVGFAHATGRKLIVNVPQGRSRSSSPHHSTTTTDPKGKKRVIDSDYCPSPLSNKVKIAGDEDGEIELVWTEQAGTSSDSQQYHVTLKHLSDEEGSTVHRWLRILDFSLFRTQGLRRTIGEGYDSRFVTANRLLALVTAAEGLTAFGASETMDSALSFEVLEALLFRDGDYAKSQTSKLRGVSQERKDDKSRTHKLLQSLDLCGCISAKFQEALAKFVQVHLSKFSGRVTSTVLEEESTSASDDDDEQDRGRGRGRNTDRRGGASSSTKTRSVSTRRDLDEPSTHPAKATHFPSLNRLGLNGVTIPPEVLHPFVLAFPRLTHLDLSATKIDASLLEALGASDTIQLESLSLSHCRRLTSESITELLVDSPVTEFLTELSLEGSILFPTPITSDDMRQIISSAPSFRSGRLRYLDLGSCPITDASLDLLSPQPAMLDLGLAACADVSLKAISNFLQQKAPNVQILDLTDSCTRAGVNGGGLAVGVGPFGGSQRGGSISAIQLQSSILGPCTSIPPLTISQQLALLGFSPQNPNASKSSNASNSATSEGGRSHGTSTSESKPRPKTNLRVVGLSSASLSSIRGGLGSWKVIWGKGRRGWCVDTSAGPHPNVLDEDLSSTSNSNFKIDEDLDHQGHERHSSLSPEARRRHFGDYDELSSGGLDRDESPFNRSRDRDRRPFNRMTSVRRAVSVNTTTSSRLSSSPYRSSFNGSNLSRSRSRHSRFTEESNSNEHSTAGPPRDEVIRNLEPNHPRRIALEALANAKGNVDGSVGWHSKKAEILLGFGLLGRESGLYAHRAYQA